MEEKQEFQLKSFYIEGAKTNFVEQRLCGHSLREAQEIAVRNFYLDVKGEIKAIRGLKEV